MVAVDLSSGIAVVSDYSNLPCLCYTYRIYTCHYKNRFWQNIAGLQLRIDFQRLRLPQLYLL